MVKIEIEINVGFFIYKELNEHSTLSVEELSTYKKYKNGRFKINNLTIEPTELGYILINLFLRWIPKICNDEKVFGTFMEKENYGLVVSSI